ncbi:uncharacterized protein LOC116194815 isoform X2 [Punica granatum]|uniref:Uncharacterized protein LOC116194815 isoform X2 n=1 Tax=Punica granatum TaxID=22663 RepID=A0A6P8CFM5_PUNGR|nr:uncharacterized protein LOC116194815 isoform X2 [Punica granatum]
MASVKSADASLWWDPFPALLTELENVPLSSDLPPHLLKKLKEDRAWFVDTLSLFKPPNEKSREALNSQQLKIGSHELNIKSELKDKALQISSSLGLDEVQSYILVERSTEHVHVPLDSVVQDFTHLILLQYYIERQCLLKCTRRILMHALCAEDGPRGCFAIQKEALELSSTGLDGKLVALLDKLLSSTHPEQMGVDLFTLWAEETLTEDNLILEILFLIYYEPFCACNAEKWKKLCSLYEGISSGSCNFDKLAVSAEALNSSQNVKVQLLFILIETLDLENLLQMVHDETPFRLGISAFSLSDIQEIDAIVSSISPLEMRDAGPLFLAWAVFICLVMSLSGPEENNVLMDIDHVGYVRQAFEAGSLNFFMEILQNVILKESDGSFAGYRSVLRTFISAFIASYEINYQLDDSTFNLILDILCKLYRGEESLCMQFWDGESFIDGPIRCLLCNVEGEFPQKTVELVRLLSSLCDGNWPAECVYNFLDKSVGISSLFEITDDSLLDGTSQIVETRLPLHVPGVESLQIPSKTRGHVLRVVGRNVALVRWEYGISGVFVLLLRLAQQLYINRNEEVFHILDLFNRMVSFNTGLCFSLMNLNTSLYVQSTFLNVQTGQNMWVVEVICSLFRNLYPSSANAALISMGINFLAKMLKCSWFLSGKLAKMLLIDCEHNDYDCSLTISVLEFTNQLVESGLESGAVYALLVFSLQYILVNHEYWKYKVKRHRWRVTLKVLELVGKCIISSSYSKGVADVIQNILLSDSSIHSTFFRIVCTTSQSLEQLYVSRLIDVAEIEGLQLAILSALDVLHVLLLKFSKDNFSSLPLFHQAMLSSSTKPIPVAAAVISFISYFRNPAIQVGAARVLSSMLFVANDLQQQLSGIACFSPDDKQIMELRHSLGDILLEKSLWDEDLFLATVDMLTSAARFQPAFLLAIIDVKEAADAPAGDAVAVAESANASPRTADSKSSSVLNAVLQFVEKSAELVESKPQILLTVLEFLKALWEGAAQYSAIIDHLKDSKNFWKHLSSSVSFSVPKESHRPKTWTEKDSESLANSFHCQGAILEVMAHNLFLQKKLLLAESHIKRAIEKAGHTVSTDKSRAADPSDCADIFFKWSESSVLQSMVKIYSSCEDDGEVSSHVKIAASLFAVHVMVKLTAGDVGSLSISLLDRIGALYKELRGQPAFSELLGQYSKHRYSEGKELETLILNDLYYHMQGEFEGRKIGPGPFQELFLSLVRSNIWERYYEWNYKTKLLDYRKKINLFDTAKVRADLRLDLWDHSNWKASKVVAETMLQCMEETNWMIIFSASKLSALKALTTLLAVYEEDALGRNTGNGRKIPDKLVLSCIDQMCESFHSTLRSLGPTMEASEDILKFLAAQAELIIHLIRKLSKSPPLPVCVLILRTSGSALKVLGEIKPVVKGIKTTLKLGLMLLLLSLEFSCSYYSTGGAVDMDSVKETAEFSNLCLGHIPILCSCIMIPELYTLTLTAVDLISRNFLMPNTWFPIIQAHLPLQHIISKLHDRNSAIPSSITLNFLLTLAVVRGGAEMLLSSGLLSSLRALFSAINEERNLSVSSNGTEGGEGVWGLGLAVVAAMIHSLGDTSSCINIVDSEIPYFFSDQAYLVSYYLDAPDLPSGDQDKRRPQAQRTQTSLTALKETEHVLTLMCVGARQWNSWVKAMKEMDPHLREKSIHLLAFISRGNQRFGESLGWNAPFLCPPVCKSEMDDCKKPPFVNSKNGWFSLSPPGCLSVSKFSSVSTSVMALVQKDRAPEKSETVSATTFSDTVALQIYRIAFHLLKFLCLQAEGAAKRAEEVGFIDLAHFPELPMPEILHGLQDQAIAIVTELCEASKAKQMNPETCSICILLLHILEMALHLELCVLHICGIRPVLGRVEDFSKQVKPFVKAIEGQDFLKSSLSSLKRIMSLVYPGLLQAEGLL